MVGTKTGVWIAVLMLAGANGIALLGSRSSERTLRADLAGLPGDLGEWVGGPATRAGEVGEFGGDDVLSREYIRPTGERLWLYIGFWRRQREGQPVAFSPRQAYPGPEWKVVSSTVAWIGGEEGKPRGRVRQVIFQRFARQQAVTYWYVQGGGRAVTDWSVGRLAMVWDAVRWRRSDVTLVRLASPVSGGEAAEVFEVQRRFAEQLAPLLASYLPG